MRFIYDSLVSAIDPGCRLDQYTGTIPVYINGDSPRLQEVLLAGPSEPPRKLRADARRNRERLLEIAREAFIKHGAEASLDDIAKRAGVGSATLYRHYPTREALIEAVYRRDVEKLGALGDEMINSKPPVEALRAWMYLFVEHTDEKHILAPALTNSAYESAGVVIQETIKKLVNRAIKSKELRDDTVPFDLLRALIGVSQMRYMPEWQESAKRLIEILIRGGVNHGSR